MLGNLILLIAVGLFCFDFYEIYLMHKNNKMNQIADEDYKNTDHFDYHKDCNYDSHDSHEDCPWDEPTNNEEVFVNNEDYK